MCSSPSSTVLVETSAMRLEFGVFSRGRGVDLGFGFLTKRTHNRLHPQSQCCSSASVNRLGRQQYDNLPWLWLNFYLEFSPFHGLFLLNRPYFANETLESVSSSLIHSSRSYNSDYQAMLDLHLFKVFHICSKESGWIWFQAAFSLAFGLSNNIYWKATLFEPLKRTLPKR